MTYLDEETYLEVPEVFRSGKNDLVTVSAEAIGAQLVSVSERTAGECGLHLLGT